ncbi:hypothetical protein COS18_02170, partial [Candidatus Falkowbacteria bacterium CG02_land_8_20_14_3_00_36_14]
SVNFNDHRRFAPLNNICATKPFKLIFYETFTEKKDATAQKVFYKSGYGREVLKGKLKIILINKYSGIV